MTPLERLCATPQCNRPAAHQRTRCTTCRSRLHRNGDPTQRNRTPDQHAITETLHTRRALPGMTPTERRLTAQKLDALGLPASEIARILNRTPRTVYRWRAQARATAATKQTTST